MTHGMTMEAAAEAPVGCWLMAVIHAAGVASTSARKALSCRYALAARQGRKLRKVKSEDFPRVDSTCMPDDSPPRQEGLAHRNVSPFGTDG